MQTRSPLWMKEMEAGRRCHGDREHIRLLGNRPSRTSRGHSHVSRPAYPPLRLRVRTGFLAPDQPPTMTTMNLPNSFGILRNPSVSLTSSSTCSFDSVESNQLWGCISAHLRRRRLQIKTFSHVTFILLERKCKIFLMIEWYMFIYLMTAHYVAQINTAPVCDITLQQWYCVFFEGR